MQLVLVKVHQLVADDQLSSADAFDCARGTYEIALNDHIPAGRLADAALDVFHGAISLEDLDHFAVAVTDREGVPLLQDPEASAYAYIEEGFIRRRISAESPAIFVSIQSSQGAACDFLV